MGGAFRPQWRKWPAKESQANLVPTASSRMPPPFAFRFARPKISSSATDLPVPQWVAGSDASQNEGSLPVESSAERSTHGARP
jgi:hypothetical protein